MSHIFLFRLLAAEGIAQRDKITITVLCAVCLLLLAFNIFLVIGLHRLNSSVKVRAALKARKNGSLPRVPIGGEVRTVTMSNGEQKTLNFSFSANLNGSDDNLRSRYSNIKNALLSFSEVTSFLSWEHETFTVGSEILAIIGIYGGSLYINLPVKNGLPCDDLSTYEQYKPVPYRYNLTDSAIYESVLTLISSLAVGKNLTYVVKAPYSYNEPRQSFETLEFLGLVK